MGGGWGVGGGEMVQGYEHEPPYFLYTTPTIVTTSSTELYSFMKIILKVFKIESIAA